MRYNANVHIFKKNAMPMIRWLQTVVAVSVYSGVCEAMYERRSVHCSRPMSLSSRLRPTLLPAIHTSSHWQTSTACCCLITVKHKPVMTWKFSSSRVHHVIAGSGVVAGSGAGGGQWAGIAPRPLNFGQSENSLLLENLPPKYKILGWKLSILGEFKGKLEIFEHPW